MPKPSRLSLALLYSTTLITALGVLISALLFYTEYWQWRQLFDASGRYFSPEDGVVYHEQSGYWLLLALGFALALGALLLWVRALRRQ